MRWTVRAIFSDVRVASKVCASLLFLAIPGISAAADSRSADIPQQVTLKEQRSDSPLVLSQPVDYVLQKVNLTGLHDSAALTLTGQISSVTIQNCQFGDIVAGPRGKAAALDAAGAVVGTLTATDSAFFDAENQLVSLREGSFGTVTFLHCSFKTSDAFLKRIYTQTPWRTWPPTAEFYNIDRLELLDNEYSNTTIIIHPSVKTVVFRGDISKVQVQSPNTQVIRLAPHQDPDDVLPPDRGALAATPLLPAVPDAEVIPSSPASDARENDAAVPTPRETDGATLPSADRDPAERADKNNSDLAANRLALSRVQNSTIR